MRRSILIPLLLGALAAWCGSCIENNLPYPVVELAVLSCEGEGFTAEIDAKTRTVVLRLDETTDISRVRITDMRITAVARASAPLTGEFDLRTPQFITLSLYQDYEWELRAEQRIERRFAVEGQIGAAEIDSERRTATAHVGMDADLRAVRITDLKLGPEGITTLNPAPEELTDFSSVRYVYVTYHDFEERWALYVRQTELVVALSAADLWRNTGTLSIASQPGAETVTLEYRRSGTEEWRAADVTLAEDGTCSARIAPRWSEQTNAAGLTVHTIDPTTGLFAGRTYEYRLTVDGTVTDEGTFETPAGDPIPQGGMEEAGMSCFTQQNADAAFWASGNNTFAGGLCQWSTFPGMEGAHCAKMAATSAAGVLAAGNLLSGIFYKDGLTKGVVEFGQPYDWTARPTALHLKYYAEKIGIVDVDMHDGAPIGAGQQDVARIFVAIVDWNGRHKVTSGTAAPTGTWDPEQSRTTDEGAVIAYGSLSIGASSEGGQMIDTAIPLFYYDAETKPSGRYSIVLSCATSAYGDFMVGCKSNVLYVDDFSWVY